jgi:hypothetical protein
MPPQRTFEVEPGAAIRDEIRERGVDVDALADEAIHFLNDPTQDVDDMALARMFAQRGYSEDLANWLVREAEVRRAPR